MDFLQSSIVLSDYIGSIEKTDPDKTTGPYNATVYFALLEAIKALRILSKKYYVFLGHDYGRGDGWGEQVGAFRCLEEAKMVLLSHEAEHGHGNMWGHIVDITEGKIILDFDEIDRKNYIEL